MKSYYLFLKFLEIYKKVYLLQVPVWFDFWWLFLDKHHFMEALLKGWYFYWPNKTAIPCGNVHNSWILLLGYGMYHINYQFCNYINSFLSRGVVKWLWLATRNGKWKTLLYLKFYVCDFWSVTDKVRSHLKVSQQSYSSTWILCENSIFLQYIH